MLAVGDVVPVAAAHASAGEVDQGDVVRRNLALLTVHADGESHAAHIDELTAQLFARPQREGGVLLGDRDPPERERRNRRREKRPLQHVTSPPELNKVPTQQLIMSIPS